MAGWIFKRGAVRSHDVGTAQQCRHRNERRCGFSYAILLCIAFDLALLRACLDETFPQFAFHDGVFESPDDRKREKLLAVTRRATNLGLQSIITLIDSDLPPGPDGEPVLEPTEIGVLLRDEGDDVRLLRTKPW